MWQLLPGQPVVPIHVTVPRSRGARSRRGLVVHRALLPPEAIGSPPRTTVCVTTVAMCHEVQHRSEITALLGRVAQQYPDALEEIVALATDRSNLRWRAEILAAAEDVAGGAQSALERRYLVDVERAHGLPVGSRQRAVGRTRRDVYYDGCATTVEFDGRAIHRSAAATWRDRKRDTLAAVRGGDNTALRLVRRAIPPLRGGG